MTASEMAIAKQLIHESRHYYVRKRDGLDLLFGNNNLQ